MGWNLLGEGLVGFQENKKNLNRGGEGTERCRVGHGACNNPGDPNVYIFFVLPYI